MKRTTWILLIILLVLVGLLVYLKQDHNLEILAESTPAEPVEFLFNETEGLPTAISIASNQGEVVAIMRSESGTWQVDEPLNAEADQAYAEAAATQVTALRVLSKPEVPPEAAGLLPPTYTLRLQFTSGTEKVVRIGDLTPTGSGYYAIIDEKPGVLILDMSGVEALLTILQSPPYLLTPTPSQVSAPTPQDGEVPTPSIYGSETPEP